MRMIAIAAVLLAAAAGVLLAAFESPQAQRSPRTVKLSAALLVAGAATATAGIAQAVGGWLI
jgi:hypothetical protein